MNASELHKETQRFLKAIDQLGADITEAVRQAEEEAQKETARINDLRYEYREGHDRLEAIAPALDKLILDAKRAELEDDHDREAEIKIAYQRLSGERRELEARLPTVEAELQRAVPRPANGQPGGLPMQTELEQSQRVSKIYSARIGPLLQLKKTIDQHVNTVHGKLYNEQMARQEWHAYLSEQIRFHPEVQAQRNRRDQEAERYQVEKLRAAHNAPRSTNPPMVAPLTDRDDGEEY